MQIVRWVANQAGFRPVDARNVRWLDSSDQDYALFCRFIARPLPRDQYRKVTGCCALIEDREIVALAYEATCSEEAAMVGGVETLAPFRRRGHAQAVVSFATAHILAAGRSAVMWTRDDQPAMVRVAESLGYKQQEAITVIKWTCDTTCFRSAESSKARWLDWGDTFYPFSREKYEKMLYWGGGRLSAVVEDGKIVAEAYEQPRSTDVAEIVSVSTLPPFRGRGYAKAVVSFVTAHILADGRTATMETRDDNIPMIHVAEAVGYRRSEPVPGTRP